MNGRCFVVLEAHARSATLYLQGQLGAPEVERAVTLCLPLPGEIASLRIDARGASAADGALQDLVEILETRWPRQHRRGSPRSPSGTGEEPAVVTVSLHDRAEPVTGSGHYPGDRMRPMATSA